MRKNISVKEKIKQILQNKIQQEIILEVPKKRELGDFATPIAFSLAKKLKKSPIKIAEDLVNELNTISEFEKVEAVRGFINIYITDNFINQEINLALKSGLNFGSAENNEKILIEFVSANPTGPLHIGHLRGAIYGDGLVRLGRKLGYKIDTEYYINDAGRQIYLLGVSLQYAGLKYILNREIEEPEEYYRGEYIIDLAKEAYQYFQNPNCFDDENLEKLAVFGKDKMMEEIRSNLKNVNIEFDNFVSEKKLQENWETALNILEKNNGIYKDKNMLWLKSKEFGDEFDRVIVRENNIPTYLAGDIVYHYNKFSRNYDKYINIWGADHHGYITRVKAAIKYLGFEPEKLEIILTQMVSLLKDGQPYKMSKRAGNFILMRDVVDEVGANSLRYAFLSKTADIPLKFDINDLNKMDNSNPHFYINYAYSRIKSLLRKSKFNLDEVANTELKNLDINLRELSILALKLPEVFVDSFETRQIFKITEYLKDLASKLHSFYNSSTILGSENEKDILKVLLLVANSIKVGLETLGIKVQERL
jgi:arginyl-tRNA synthetase